MGQRRQARELALQFLFQHDFWEQTFSADRLERDWQVFCRHFDAGQRLLPYAYALVEGVWGQHSAIDSLLGSFSRNWRLERMSLVDRNILRLAVYELCFGPDVPERVVINEALEIAKRFGTEDSPPFINGVLDAVCRSRQAAPAIT